MIGRKCNLQEQMQYKDISKLMSVHQFVAILMMLLNSNIIY